jgi:hypothetical protein
VQEADDDERGSVNTPGEELGGRRNASKQGGVGPPEQPAQLQRPHAPQRAPPDYLARRWEPDPDHLAERSVRRGIERIYKGESGRSATRRSRLRTTTSQNRTEPLEIIPLYRDEEKEPDYYLFVTREPIRHSVTPVPERTPVLHYNLRGHSHLLQQRHYAHQRR